MNKLAHIYATSSKVRARSMQVHDLLWMFAVLSDLYYAAPFSCKAPGYALTMQLIASAHGLASLDRRQRRCPSGLLAQD